MFSLAPSNASNRAWSDRNTTVAIALTLYVASRTATSVAVAVDMQRRITGGTRQTQTMGERGGCLGDGAGSPAHCSHPEAHLRHTAGAPSCVVALSAPPPLPPPFPRCLQADHTSLVVVLGSLMFSVCLAVHSALK